MKVEETFDITIDDAEAEKLLTPGQLIELVMAKVGRTDHAACLTQRAFHRLRAALIKRLGLQRRQIRPTTPLAEIFPQPNRRQQLRQILADLDIAKQFELIRPQWLHRLLLGGIFGGGAAIMILLAWHPVAFPYVTVNFFTTNPVVAGVAFAIAFGFISFKTTTGMRYEFSPTLNTVAGLSRWIVANNPDLVNAPPGQWSREQVAEIVRGIVIDVLGCHREYREDAQFVKDLGLS